MPEIKIEESAKTENSNRQAEQSAVDDLGYGEKVALLKEINEKLSKELTCQKDDNEISMQNNQSIGKIILTLKNSNNASDTDNKNKQSKNTHFSRY